MKKRKTLSALKTETWHEFSIYIRTRDCLRTTGSPDYGECFTCDETKEFAKLDAGHFIPGRHSANLFSERGVQAQCKTCNGFHGGRPLEYRRQIIKRYGEGVDEELEEIASQVKQFSRQELIDLKEYYKDKTRELMDWRYAV